MISQAEQAPKEKKSKEMFLEASFVIEEDSNDNNIIIIIIPALP